MVALMVLPVLRSNSGVIRSIAHRMPPGAMSVTSPARDADGALRASATTVTDMTSFISVPRATFRLSRVDVVLEGSRARRAPLAAVLRLGAFDFHENRPSGVVRIGHHFGVRTEAGFRISHTVWTPVVNRLRQRASGATRAVRVEHGDPASRVDPDVEDVADVLVLERFFRTSDLLPHDHVLVLEQLGRAFARELWRPLHRGRPRRLRRGADGNACADTAHTKEAAIEEL